MTKRSILRAQRARQARARRRTSRLAAVLTTGLVAGVPLAQAQDATWLAAPANSSFSSGVNWSTGSTPTGTATFDTSNTTTVALGAGSVTVGTMQFNAGAPAYSFTGSGTVTLNGQGIVNNSSNAPSISMSGGTLAFTNSASAGNATISATSSGVTFSGTSSGGTARIILNSSSSLTLSGLTASGTMVGSVEGVGNVVLGSKQLTTGGNNLSSTLSGVISGSGGSLVKEGTGTMTLAGANTYTGATTISGGTLQLGGGGTTGSIASSTITNNGTLAVNHSDSLTINGTISGSGALGQIGTGTTILAADNTFTGTTTIANGTLQLGTNQASGSLAGSLGSGNVVNNGALVVNRQSANSIAGDISGTGTLTINGVATTYLTGNNTYSGTTTLNSGVLQIGTGGTSGTLGTGNVVNNSGFAGLVFNRSDTVMVANNISGTGSLSQGGTGTTILTGSNTYSGTTTVSTGTLQVGNGGTAGSIGTGNVSNNASLVFNRSDDISVGGLISGSGRVTKLGAGTLTLSNTNTYTGGTTISEGTLQLGNGGTTGSIGGAITNNGNLTVNRSNSYTMSNVISGSGSLSQVGSGTTILNANNSYSGTTTITSGTLQVGNTGSLGSLGTGNVVNNSNLVFNRSDAVTVANDISGSGTLGKSGGGTIFLTGNNTYGGTTTITSGSLQIGGGGSTGSLGSGNVVNNANLTFNRSDDITVANVISGSGSLGKAAAGTTTIVANNSYTGTTTISAGTLQVGNGGTTGSLGTGAFTVNAGGTLTYNRSDDLTVASALSGGGNLTKLGTNKLTLTGSGASFSGTTTIAGGTLQVGNGGTGGTLGSSAVANSGSLVINRAGSLTLSGAISGSGTLSNIGNGTTTLTGDNTYTGITTISSGVVDVGGGTASGAIVSDVVNNGTLRFARTNAYTYGGAISGSGAVGITGTGTITLAGDNSYSGGTTIASGTLQVGNGGTAGGLGTGNIANNSALVFNRSNALTVAGAISGIGTLTQAGTGTTILAANNSYTGATTISSGTLQVGDGGTTGTLGTANVANAGVLVFNRSNALVYGGVVSGAGALSQAGTGTTTLTGSNTYLGDTTIAAGTLQIGNGGTTGSIGAGNVINNGTLAVNRSDNITLANAVSGTGNLAKLAGNTLTLTGNNGYTGTTTIAAGTLQVGDGGTTGELGSGATSNSGSLVFNRTGTLAVASAISGTGSLTQAGPGTAVLTGDNSYSGATTIAAGTLQVGSGGTSGTLGSGNVANDTALVFNRSDALGYGGVISGAGTVTQAGTGTTTLAGNNTYLGVTTISGGSLQIGNGGTAGTLGTGNVVNDGDLTFNRSDSATVANAIAGAGTLTQSGSGTTVLTANNSYSGITTVSAGTLQVGNGGITGSLGSGNVVNNAALAFNRADDVTVANVISGTGSLTQAGTNTLTLTADNSYSGGTTISAGTLQVGNGGTAGSLGTGAVSNGGTLAFNRADATTIANVISGSGALVQGGSGTTVLIGDNSYSGITTVSAGTLQVGDGGTTGSLGTGSVVNNAALAFNRSDDVAVANAISGTGSLVQLGANTLTLTGSNSYSGTTTISAGTLQIGNGGTSGTLGTGSVVNNATIAFNRSDDVAVGNAISGTGNLVQLGGNTLTLTGANSYSGTTTISAGTLQIGNGGTSGTLGNGGIVNNATIAFNRSDDVAVANAISGSGNLVKLGANTLTLAGANSYTGTTTISAGTLQIGNGGTTGNLGSGNVVNNGTLAFNRADTMVYGGVISGNGAVSQVGAGTTVLTGSNTYTGGTTITGGTLQVGNGGTTGSIVGNVANGGVLAFNRADNITFGGNISGSGSILMMGAGTVALTGANTFTGGATVSAGRLAVNGSLASGVTVGSAGTLSGSGTISGSVANAGTIAPGNSIGTLNVSGSFTQLAGGVYQVEVNAAGQSDRISVSGSPGSATLQGGTVSVQADSGSYGSSTTYTILSATGGVSGAYSSVTSNFAFLTPSLAYDANNVYLTLARSSSAFANGAQTPNQRAVGTVLDLAAPGATGDFATVIGALTGLSAAQGPAALSTISGLAYSGFSTAAVQTGQLFMNQVGQQLQAARAGEGAGNRLALAESCSAACEEPAPSRWGVWGSALGGTAYTAGNDNAAAVTSSAAGFTAGIDYRVDPRLLIGIAAGYANGSQWTQGVTGKGTSDSFLVSLYASFTAGGFYLDGMAGYAYSDNQMWRPMTIAGLQPRTAYGHTGASQFLGQVETGYAFGLGGAANATLTPFLRLQGSTTTQNAFSETGAGSINLSVAAQTTNSLVGSIGADLSAKLDLGWRDKLALNLRLGFAHEFADTSRPVTASFAGAPGLNFTVFGATPARDSAVLGLNASTSIADGTRLFLRYDGMVRGGNSNQAITAGIRMSW